jgi:putative transposase
MISGAGSGGGGAYDPDRHHRRTVRLRGYDYGQIGAYFVTICTEFRESRLGEIVDDAMRLNVRGRIVEAIWDGIPDHVPGVELDEFVVMPNHGTGLC